MYIFDFDGTLVDTKQAVVAAYTKAGVHKTPEEWEDVWGKPWKEWLFGKHGEDIHKHKTKYFPEFMKAVQPMPLLPIALKIKAPVITSASQSSVVTVMNYLTRFIPSIADLRIVLVGATWRQKADYLDWASSENDMDLIYVDDSERIRTQLNERATRWKAINPEECLVSLRSYLPPGRTHDLKG